MEWALFIKRPEELQWLDRDFTEWYPGDSEDHLLPSETPPDISFSRIYFGNEFSEALIPASDELEQCFIGSLERGLSFTLVTPRVTDPSIEKLKTCFDLLSRSSKAAEVIINDWGVLRLLRNKYHRLIPVLGRIPNRSHRGYDRSNAINLTYFPYRRFLWSNGIKRVEFDCPIQLAGVSLGKTGLSGSLYFPHDCCVISGFCLIRDLSKHDDGETSHCDDCQRKCGYLLHGTDSLLRTESEGSGSISISDDILSGTGSILQLEEKLVRVRESTIDRFIYQINTPL